MECKCGGTNFKTRKSEGISIKYCSGCGRNYGKYIEPKKKFKFVGVDANGKQIFERT